MDKAKPFGITKRMVWEAYKQVRAKGGAAGADGQTIEEFEADLEANLYRLWNRLASGSYFPPAVRRVEIPKADGGKRPLGIPTVADRIAQTVVKAYLEPMLEPVFHADSYGYRPGRSAHGALEVARQRCWRYDWVLDLDIRNFFGSMPWGLLMRAVRRHTDCAWVLLYIERWLAAPVQLPDGSIERPERGTPQGGVISPLLANLFLHYALDLWMQQHHPQVPFERYADDVVCHCQSEAQARELWAQLQIRLAQCPLELHPHKTQVVYCRDANRRGDHPVGQFDFLGYTFRARTAKNRRGYLFDSFSPAVSTKAAKAMRQELRREGQLGRHDWSLNELARALRARLLGWVRYYGRFHPEELKTALRVVDDALVRWAQQKYKRFRHSAAAAWRWLKRIKAAQPSLFAHWQLKAHG